jgi:hypothetical protein
MLIDHAMAATHTWLDLLLVTVGVVVVVVTTVYTVLYLVRPGETGETHIKRRILEDDREGLR